MRPISYARATDVASAITTVSADPQRAFMSYSPAVSLTSICCRSSRSKRLPMVACASERSHG